MAMRIVLMTETWHPYTNGVITHISGLADGLRELGHDVLIITADPDVKRHVTDRDGVLHCPARAVKKVYGYGLASPFNFRRYAAVREFSPDVIHIHQEFGMGFFGLIASRLLGIPLVYTLHTAYDEYLHYLAKPAFLPLVRIISRTCVRLLANRASVVTGPSKKAADYLNSCGVRTPFQLIPNSVENRRFNPSEKSREARNVIRRQYHLDDDLMIAIFAGRLGREKNVDQLLTFWKEADFSKDRMHLIIAGDGPERQSLQMLASSLGISSQITFTGKISYESMVAYYAASDLYISASTTEMMSISMLEARAMGLPTIQHFDPWNEHHVTEGMNGFYFSDAKTLGEKVRHCRMMDGHEWSELIRRCKQSVGNQGTVDLASQLIQFYSTVAPGTEKAAHGEGKLYSYGERK
jgi:1,2-diacylglycerol 3-alpha-glucosyltransferase